MPTQRPNDPFSPLDGIVTFLLTLLLAGLALFSVLALVDLAREGSTGVDIATIGGQTCVPVSNETPRPALTDVRQRGVDRDEASLRVEELDLCLKDPTALQEGLSVLAPVGDLALAVGGLVLVKRVIRVGRRHGVFANDVADRVRQLGWFMLAMTLVWPLVAAAGRGVIVQEAIPGRSMAWGLLSPDISWTLVVVSCAVLSIARVLRRGVALQEDVDATV